MKNCAREEKEVKRCDPRWLCHPCDCHRSIKHGFCTVLPDGTEIVGTEGEIEHISRRMEL